MEQLLKAHHTDWLLGVLLLSWLLIIVARWFNPDRFNQVAILPFHGSRREVETTFNPSRGKGMYAFNLNVVSNIIISLSLFLLLHFPDNKIPDFSNWSLFLKLFFGISFFFIFKNFVGLFVGWVFNSSDELAESQNIHLAYRIWMSIVLAPICVIAVYWPNSFSIAYFLVALILVIGYLLALLFSSIKIWTLPLRGYYKISYLCALEITPLIYLLLWFNNQ